MRNYTGRNSKKAGLAPGALIYTGDQRIEKAKITLFSYDENSCQEQQSEHVDDILLYKDRPGVLWINVDGLHQVEVIETVGKSFGLHPLLLEDILDTGHRPKMEDLGDFVFITLKMLFSDGDANKVGHEQISLVLGPNYVLSFKEREDDIFDPIKERIRNGLGRWRNMGADYLFYALLDSVVDNYFVVLEDLGERLEILEEKLVTNPSPDTLNSIQNLKTGMIHLSRSVWPLREIIGGLERGESPLIKKSTGIYLRDVYDHTIQVIDTVETYRDMITGMLDIYLSSINNRISEVMKVLTMIATIFIPLTFIVGVYGMNFTNMPELGWKWGYPVVWLIMVVIVVLMVVYFKKKRWF